jgi:hypothetical protein
MKETEKQAGSERYSGSSSQQECERNWGPQCDVEACTSGRCYVRDTPCKREVNCIEESILALAFDVVQCHVQLTERRVCEECLGKLHGPSAKQHPKHEIERFSLHSPA